MHSHVEQGIAASCLGDRSVSLAPFRRFISSYIGGKDQWAVARFVRGVIDIVRLALLSARILRSPDGRSRLRSRGGVRASEKSEDRENSEHLDAAVQQPESHQKSVNATIWPIMR
jgi:hypothetical protein